MPNPNPKPSPSPNQVAAEALLHCCLQPAKPPPPKPAAKLAAAGAAIFGRTGGAGTGGGYPAKWRAQRAKHARQVAQQNEVAAAAVAGTS